MKISIFIVLQAVINFIMKICSKCKFEKDKLEFYSRPSTLDGLRSQCKQCFSDTRKRNKKVKSKYDSLYYLLNRERKLCNSIIYGINHKHEKSLYDKSILYRKLENNRKRYHSNINYKLLCNLRSRLYVALHKNKKIKSTLEFIGCTIEELKLFLQNQFTDGMSWDKVLNGEIHIDHIMPCASFDLSDPEQQKKCFHYTNLQPLWAADNRKKYTKIM